VHVEVELEGVGRKEEGRLRSLPPWSRARGEAHTHDGPSHVYERMRLSTEAASLGLFELDVG
jgi:hypothetical protein